MSQYDTIKEATYNALMNGLSEDVPKPSLIAQAVNYLKTFREDDLEDKLKNVVTSPTLKKYQTSHTALS